MSLLTKGKRCIEHLGPQPYCPLPFPRRCRMRPHRIRWAAQLGGAAGAIVGGALGGGRGAAVGAVVGGVTGAAIAAQGQPRPGGYRYYQQACYQQRGDGAWVAVAPQYCATAAAAPVAVAPPPPPPRVVRDELGDRMLLLREGCEDGDRRACVRLGILIGENRERRAVGGVNIRKSSFTNARLTSQAEKQVSGSSERQWQTSAAARHLRRLGWRWPCAATGGRAGRRSSRLSDARRFPPFSA